MRIGSAVFAVGVMLALVALPASAEDVYVDIVNFAYIPNDVTIQVGDTVYWTNLDSVLHTVTSGTDCTSDGLFDSGDLASGDEWSYTFESAGEYPYFCLYHCETMEGIVRVEAPTPTTQTTWAQIKALYR